MKNRGIVKRILGVGALALVLSGVVMAAPRVIDIEPDECQVRCFYILGYKSCKHNLFFCFS